MDGRALLVSEWPPESSVEYGGCYQSTGGLDSDILIHCIVVMGAVHADLVPSGRSGVLPWVMSPRDSAGCRLAFSTSLWSGVLWSFYVPWHPPRTSGRLPFACRG